MGKQRGGYKRGGSGPYGRQKRANDSEEREYEMAVINRVWIPKGSPGPYNPIPPQLQRGFTMCTNENGSEYEATSQPEGAEVDCPDCGNPAIHNDSGTYCPECSEKKQTFKRIKKLGLSTTVQILS